MTALKPLLITSGEPAGVGPEICATIAAGSLANTLNRPLVFLGDQRLLEERAQLTGASPGWKVIQDASQANSAGNFLIDIALQYPSRVGKPDTKNARYVLDLLDLACDECLTGMAAGIVTAPIQKSVISPLVPHFQGHTEYLAERCGQPGEVVMMLAGGGLKVALATTHVPLSDVPKVLNQVDLERTLRILLDALRKYWGRSAPHVLVTGLNPHAGESGTMGDEEIRIITPVLARLQAEGHLVSGPYPADTLFQPRFLKNADAVLAMYHDQGLPVLKYASFGEGVNISLGLPILRTSVDHGTALDLAGTGKANTGSLVSAIECAHQMDKHSRS